MLVLAMRLGIVEGAGLRSLNQSAWLSAPCTIEPDVSGPMFAWCAARTRVGLSHTQAPFSPDASLEVFSPSARASRDARFGAAGPERSRFGVARWLTTRASADYRDFSVAHAVFRHANVNAVVPDAGLVARYASRDRDDLTFGRLVFDRPCGRRPA